ncbi:DUF2744 domain-containing protein [Rhodococcus sp. 1168]|uniref:phage gene 29 protein family protein n=1 Tax=Rhodococcus sp. 1168 TaxID=2018041 RepID=UPI000B5ADD10|nr:DUF2744 domain-containing protein [Rhodococcus sp. 1168]
MQGQCDPDDPEEFALWALVGIEETPGVPMITTELSLRSLSKQLADAGFRHHPDLQVRKAVILGAPDVEGVHWMGVGQISWVGMDYRDEIAEAAAEQAAQRIDFSGATPAQLIDAAAQLESMGVVRAPEAAPVVDGPVVGRAEGFP